ncbi:hypothetical protein C0033_23745 [Clostridium sp. chh4-2]|nr:hypothetical protein C0033_23745 [Clostridium sp. chh4-2]
MKDGDISDAEKETVSEWQSQFELGAKYLLEGNYEEAIIVFSLAIEIDPKKTEAYMERAKAYIGSAELSAEQKEIFYEKALADLEKAKELGNKKAETEIEKLKLLIGENGNNKKSLDLLKEIYPYFLETDLENLQRLMRQDRYMEMSAAIDDAFIYYDEDGVNGLAVYPDNFYYFGQWENGMRSGYGIWVKAVFGDNDTRDIYLYSGEWTEDSPNGAGRILETRDTNKAAAGNGRRTAVRVERDGTFTNSSFEGSFDVKWTMNDGSTITWTPMRFSSGIPQPMADVPQMIKERDYYKEKVENGEYIVAVDTDTHMTDLWNSPEDIGAVLGFEH